jgi:hypothetical protein
MAHETTTLVIDGFECDVDKAIAPLIEVLNSISGVHSQNCCQGNLGLGYVQFFGQDVLKFVLSITTQMAETFERIGTTHTIGKHKYGCHFQIEIGDSEFTMRWDMHSYSIVLDAVKAVAATMNTKPAYCR